MRRGFTIVELLISLLIIALLIGLLAIGFHRLGGTATRTAEAQELAALRTGVVQFQNEFGFLPPLVDDMDPLDRDAARVRYLDPSDPDDFDVLRGATIVDPDADPDMRFSVYSLAYYVMGGLDGAIDGVEGEGFRKPRANGTFERVGGTASEALFRPTGDGGLRYLDSDLTTGRVVLLDRHGNPYRYYRWVNGDEDAEITGIEDINVPAVVGDPTQNPELRDATFAIVSAGRDGLFGDAATEGLPALQNAYGAGLSVDELQRKARQDNVVEVGR